MKIFLLTIPYCSYGQSQDNNNSAPLNMSPVEITVGIQTNLLWRGLVISDMPTVTGQLSIDLDKAKTFKIGVWGATAISNDEDNTHYKEMDYFIQYANKGFSIGLADLFNTRSEPVLGGNNIFDYDQKTTKHILDLRSSYQFPNNFPLKLEADFLLYGTADAILNKNSVKQKYSTYVEAGYPFVQNSTVNLNGFIGAAFAFDGQQGNYSLYGNGKNNFQVVNVGFQATKDVTVFNHKFPIWLTTMWNPTKKYARVQFAVTLF